MSEFERKPDGGLNDWIETYEAMGGGENDAEMLCLLLELRRRRENQTEAERQRDEMRTLAEEQSKLAGSNAARAQKAEAEISRRDAAASEPVVWIAADALNMPRHAEIKAVTIPYVLEYPVGLCLVAPPAVLPPKYADELTERAELIEAYSKTQCEIAQELGCDSDNESILKAIYELKELGAQQQKAVQLPWGEWGVFGEADLLAALDAANVKWEVKK